MAEVNHTDRGHAMLSASGAHRWMNCTPSARLESKVLEEGSSIYAKEGTLAHELAELKLRKEYFRDQVDLKTYYAEAKKIETEAKNLMGPDAFLEMEKEVSKYTVLVMESFRAAKKKDTNATILLEEKLDYSHIVPEGYGTGDTTVIGGGLLEITDLKYGKGVRVDAEENPQLVLYAAGALNAFDLYYDIKRVKMTVIQPRLDHYSTWEISVEELRTWIGNKISPKAQLAYKGEGEKQAGSWCKFCKVKALCRTLADHNLELAKHDFRNPDLMDTAEVAEIYGQVPLLLDWAKSLSDHLLKEALAGNPVPGYKLVEGRSNRRWTDEEKIREVLKSKKYRISDYMISKLGGIGHIEKLLGKDKFNKYLNGLVEKPQGSPTLVPESDKRPAFGIEQAKEDFSEEI